MAFSNSDRTTISLEGQEKNLKNSARPFKFSFLSVAEDTVKNSRH